MNILTGIGIALFVLAFIAFPELFIPNAGKKKKRFNITYWGFYNGSEDCKPEESLLADAASPNRHKITAGSSMYAKGHGVKANATK